MSALHKILFPVASGYWIPEAFGSEPPHKPSEREQSKRLIDPRGTIIRAMQSLGSRCTSREICDESGGELYQNLVNRHLEKMLDEGIVVRTGWASNHKSKGGQRSRLWRLKK